MCGRYAIIDGKRVFTAFQSLRKVKDTQGAFADLPRYNAAPMQKLPVIALLDDEPFVERMQWWLVPHWAKEPKSTFSTFNAKSETIDKSKLFAPYFKGNRCLVPADAFYEWKKRYVKKSEGGREKSFVEKDPICIRMKDEQPFMFAGIFSVWKDTEGGNELRSFSILTTEPNTLMSSIHLRMPVILPEIAFDEWLDRGNKDVDSLKRLLQPYPPEKMQAYRVLKIVNSSSNDLPECLDPIPMNM